MTTAVYSTRTDLISPYGGALVQLLVTDESERAALLAQSSHMPSIQLSQRALCDLELLAIGGFSPLRRFMGRADYNRVLEEMRLADGTLFPIPVTLNVDRAAISNHIGDEIVLRDARNTPLAIMRIEEVFQWDREREARLVLNTVDSRHPLISEMASWGTVCISGELKVLNLPHYFDFAHLRRTPAQVREGLAALGNPNVVAFQTRNPMHRAHEELTKRAAERIDGSLLIHPVVGKTRPGDVDSYTRVRTYELLVERYYDQQTTMLSLLPLAMRMAGPREALWHAIIRRNYGANHFIVGRDHAGPGNNSNGKPFYGPYEAQELVQTHAEEIGIKPLFFNEMVYVPDRNEFFESDKVPAGAQPLTLSGTQVRNDYLEQGRQLPEWFSRPETASTLGRLYRTRSQQGFCVWFTGLSGAGKSTLAELLTLRLLDYDRQATLLDGDVVRTMLSKGLGFSREDRDANILRIGYVASEIARHHGAVITAAISPYRAVRDECRQMIGEDRFIEIFVNTPLHVCEQRDVKGLYAKARRGEVKGVTGIDDPYESPHHPELMLNTESGTPEEHVTQILDLLIKRGFIREVASPASAGASSK